jgi:hypothetical protein
LYKGIKTTNNKEMIKPTIRYVITEDGTAWFSVNDIAKFLVIEGIIEGEKEREISREVIKLVVQDYIDSGMSYTCSMLAVKPMDEFIHWTKVKRFYNVLKSGEATKFDKTNLVFTIDAISTGDPERFKRLPYPNPIAECIKQVYLVTAYMDKGMETINQ